MAKKLICSIDGCDKPVKARGWCGGHWWRWKNHGHPKGGRSHERGDALRFYTEKVLSYKGNDCLLWPFSSVRGYGQIRYNGTLVTVSRLACIEIHGNPPGPNYDAAHSCGNGHLGCVTPTHLSWKTRADNIADKVLHGTQAWGEKVPTSKLTENDILNIKSLSKDRNQREIAEIYSIDQSHVSRILSGEVWARLGGD